MLAKREPLNGYESESFLRRSYYCEGDQRRRKGTLVFYFVSCVLLVHEVLYCILQTTGQTKGGDESTAFESFLPSVFRSPLFLCINP